MTRQNARKRPFWAWEQEPHKSHARKSSKIARPSKIGPRKWKIERFPRTEMAFEGGGRTRYPNESFRKRPGGCFFTENLAIPTLKVRIANLIKGLFMQIVNMKIADVHPYEKNPRFNDDAVDAVANAPPVKIHAKIYERRYLVTTDGTVYTMGIKGGSNIHRQKLRPNGHGYLRASINRHDEYVHRIVAKCFIPNPNGYDEVNHRDGIKSHNSADNLEWCTRSENNRHAFQTGLRSYDELRKMARMPRFSKRRLTPNQVCKVRHLIINGTSCSAIARLFHCSRSVIDGIHNLKTYREEFYQ